MGKNAYLLTKLQLNDVEKAVDQATPDYALGNEDSPRFTRREYSPYRSSLLTYTSRSPQPLDLQVLL
jgi:hypothetical protein